MPEKKPTRTADLDYFYGQSSELFSFYRIPKLLFQDSRFQPLSTDAKTLYGILLDRMSLSARNGWLDKAGRVFIIYTVQEVQDSLGCADKKATKLLRELEEYGLIERKRRGLGKPDLIYVKNFSSESSKLRFLNRDNDDSGVVQNTLQGSVALRSTLALKALNGGFRKQKLPRSTRWCAPPRSRRNSLPPCCASLQLPPRPRLRCPQSVLRSTRRNLIMKMMNKFCALMLSVALCAGMAAPAFAYGGEPVEEAEQPVLTSTTDEEDVVTVTDEETGALTPEGNLTLVDDYHTNYSDGSGQQFITLVSKSGATFYLVIDRNAKGQQTVHFMNLVDEADLLTLMEEDAADAYTAEKEAAAQAEQDKLKAEEEAKKAAEEAAASGEEQPKENKVTSIASGFLGVVVLIALAAGGGFYAFTKQKQKKQAEKEALDPDANYTEDKGDFEIPTEDEPEDTGEEDTEPI